MSGSIAAAVVVAGGAAYASNKAASAQKKASREATAAQSDIASQELAFAKQQWADQKVLQKPWRTAGIDALKEIKKGVYELPDAFSYRPDQLTNDPGYNFRLKEGMKALDRQAASRGGLISGNALRAATRYGQEMGSQEYQSAYNRALTEYNARVQRSDTGYNRLAGQAGIGQTATGQLAAAGQNLTGQSMNTLGRLGQNIGENIVGAGNARASGYVGTANALSQGLSYYQDQQYINSLNKPQNRPPYSDADYTNTPSYLRR